MIPLVGFAEELRRMRELVEEVVEEELEQAGVSSLPVLVGTMIELPRAAVCADQIAQRRRLLLLRHQRPDADDARALAATTRRASSWPPTSRTA